MKTAVLGMQWGDEGKGKIVDILAEHHDYIVRFNGGNNAGHTVKVGDRTYKFHHIPSGIVWGKTCIMGNGMVIDPEVLIKEMDGLDPGLEENLYLSDRAHLIMPQHKAFEAALEAKNPIGTTKRGIGPAYSAKALRKGAYRVGNLVDRHGNVDRDKFWKKLNEDPFFDILEKTYGVKLSREEIFETYCKLAERYKNRVRDTGVMLAEAMRKDKHILFEGAQGTMLDIDHGTYPYVTSSNPTIGGASSGSGVRVIPDKVIGVLKAYTTRVGDGPFPTEFVEEGKVKSSFPPEEELKTMGKTIKDWELGHYDRKATIEGVMKGNPEAMSRFVRVEGGEYGTTTGRPRRTGWLDLVVGKYAKRINGITEVALTKLDVLSDLPMIELCYAYLLGEMNEIDYFPSRLDDVEKCIPVPDSFQGWEGDISDIRSVNDLPLDAKNYVKGINRELGTPITMIGVGPERSQTIFCNPE